MRGVAAIQHSPDWRSIDAFDGSTQTRRGSSPTRCSLTILFDLVTQRKFHARIGTHRELGEPE